MALQHHKMLGTFPAGIVGCQYYGVPLDADDMVRLEREPHNLYDSNAVMMLDASGDQVGYLKRELAEVVAPIMDERTLQFSACVPAARIQEMTDYFVPLEIEVYGHGRAAKTALSNLMKGVQGFSADGKLLFEGRDIIINFGRHKGSNIMELAVEHTEYVGWMINERVVVGEARVKMLRALKHAQILQKRGPRHYVLSPARVAAA